MSQGERGSYPRHFFEASPDRLDSSAKRTAVAVARNYVDAETGLRLMRKRPPSFTYVSESPNIAQNIAIRLIRSKDMPNLFKKINRNSALIRALHTQGAQVEDFLHAPEEIDGFVATISRHLPDNNVSYSEYGKALASLHDAHMGNVLADAQGNATLIDIVTCISSGPAAYDFARPLDQWTPRFGRPFSDVLEFISEYTEGGGREPDQEMVDLGVQIANIRYAVSPLGHAVDAFKSKQADSKDARRVSETMRRLMYLHDRDFPWNSEETLSVA